MSPDLSFLPQNPSVADQSGMAPGMQELNQAAAIPQLQQLMQQLQQQQAPADPLEEVRSRLSQTPQDKLAELTRKYYGQTEGQKEPTSGQKRKKMLQELLVGLFSKGYEGPKERLTKEAQQDYEQETKRMSLAPGFERVDQQREAAALRDSQLKAQMEQKKAIDEMKGQLEKDRLASQTKQGADKIGVMMQQLGLGRDKLNQQAPLVQAQAGLIGAKTKNEQATLGLKGTVGAGAAISQLPPEVQAAMYAGIEKTRNAEKFKPQPRASGQGAAPRTTIMESQVFNPDSDQVETVRKVVPFDPRTLPAEGVELKGVEGGLSKDSAKSVTEFGEASKLARDLAQNYSNSLKDGSADNFTGMWQGNPATVFLRSKGLMGDAKSPQEALSQILGINGLFKHVSAFAGRRITNRELQSVKEVLGEQSDDVRSSLAASVMSSYALEMMKLRAGNVISKDADPAKMMYAMAAEAKKFIGDSLAKKGPSLRPLTEVLAQNGMLNRGSQTAAAKVKDSSTPRNVYDGITLQDLQKETERRKAAKGKP